MKIEDETLAFFHKYQLLIFHVFIEPKGLHRSSELVTS